MFSHNYFQRQDHRGGSFFDSMLYKQEANSDLEEPSSGCTACATLIRDNKLIVANAGDSRCVMSKGGQVLLSAHFILERT